MDIRLVAFDMDGTLIKKRTIFVFAEKLGFISKLEDILQKKDLQPYQKTILIASLLKNYYKDELLEFFREIPLQDHITEVISKLREKDIITTIITDSYDFVAEDLMFRLHLDDFYANNLIIRDGIITGEVIIHNKNLLRECDNKIYSICKSKIIEDLCDKLGISLKQVIAVGDGIVDRCMLKKSGVGIAFNAPTIVQKSADYTTNDLRDILRFI